MGIFSFIGKAIGSVVKLATGDVGGAVKGIAGAVLGSGSKGSSGSSQQYIQSPKTSLADLKASHLSSTALNKTQNDVKVAKTVDTPQIPGSKFLLADPWQPTRDWWSDLGGDDERAKKINKNDLELF